jgi:hypothetical protein
MITSGHLAQKYVELPKSALKPIYKNLKVFVNRTSGGICTVTYGLADGL